VPGNARGNELEKRALRYLEGRGYVVERAQRTYFPIGPGILRSRRNDIFGAFDLLALHPEEAARLVQVSTASNRAKKRAKVDQFLAAHPRLGRSPHVGYEVWVWGRWKGGRDPYPGRVGYGFDVQKKNRDGVWYTHSFVESAATR
jgi:hypothetical protein